MKTLLITGINGYLGSNLAKRYSNEYNVIGLEYSKNNIGRIKDEFFEVFESKDGIPDEIFEKHSIDYIIHTATFYGRDEESDSKMIYANTFLPQALIEKAIKNGCELVINTDTVLDRFTNSYALSKKQFSDWLQFYSNSNKIKVVNLELEHFYGPGTSSSNFITLMTQKMLSNQEVIPLTHAEQNRDFLYIDDLLNVYDLIIEKSSEFDNYETFNVGTGVNTKLKYILQFIKTYTSSSSKLDFGAVSYRINELMESQNNISKLMNLGWKSKTSIEKGLLKIIKFEKDKNN